MYQIISDIKMLDRFDLDVTDTPVLTSGFQGSWVSIDSNDQAFLINTWAAGDQIAYVVWTEENHDGTQGFTPDTGQTNKVTVVSGPHRAITDKYDHTADSGLPTLGCLLIPGAGQAAASIGSASGSGADVNGMLVSTATLSNQRAVAICTKAPYLYTPVHGGTARYVIEIQVI